MPKVNKISAPNNAGASIAIIGLALIIMVIAIAVTIAGA